MATVIPVTNAKNITGSASPNITTAKSPFFNTGSTNIKPSAASALGNAFGLNNSVQYDNNLDLMNHANAFNQFMSDTAYQRTFADMEKAGVNPLVAFALGKGQLDSSPQSATATTSSNSGVFGKMLVHSLLKLFSGFDF